MIHLAADILVQASAAAFLILLLGEWRYWVVEKAPTLISKAFDCDFCLSFWSNILVASAWLPFQELALYSYFVAVLSTAITRRLIV